MNTIRSHSVSKTVILSFALLVAACGGGSPVPDTIAPTILSFSPGNSATGVANTTTVAAAFSENIKSSTVDTARFVLTGNDKTNGTVTFDGTTNTATFTPANGLALLTTYTATLSSGITDWASNGLASDFRWSFTTGDGSWGTAALIETNNTSNAVTPQVARDPNGNAIAVWSQGDGTRNNIWANRYDADTGWGTAQLIETDNKGHAYDPQVAIDASGNAIAVWRQNDGTRDNIWANRFFAATGWGTAELIETKNAGTATEPHVAMQANGNAIAVWKQNDGTRDNIQANRYVANSGWGTAVLIETDNAGNASQPRVAIDTNGNAIALWSQSDTTRTNIWANRYVPGTGWGTAAVIENDNSGNASGPALAFDADGNAIAVWHQRGASLDNIRSNRYVSGTGWGTAATIENNNAGNASEAQITIDAQGNAIAVWKQSDGSLNHIWSNRYARGTGWGTAAAIESNNAGSASSPQVVLDATGNAIAVWSHSDGSRDSIWANRYVLGTGWGTPALLETDDAGTAILPQLALDANGTAVVLWSQNDGTRTNISSVLFK